MPDYPRAGGSFHPWNGGCGGSLSDACIRRHRQHLLLRGALESPLCISRPQAGGRSARSRSAAALARNTGEGACGDEGTCPLDTNGYLESRPLSVNMSRCDRPRIVFCNMRSRIPLSFLRISVMAKLSLPHETSKEHTSCACSLSLKPAQDNSGMRPGGNRYQRITYLRHWQHVATFLRPTWPTVILSETIETIWSMSVKISPTRWR